MLKPTIANVPKAEDTLVAGGGKPARRSRGAGGNDKSPASTVANRIGIEIRTLRQSAGITAAEVARRTGLSTAMLSRIERGSVSPSIASLELIAHALHVPIGRFFANYETRRDSSIVRAGEGIRVHRYGSKSDQTYELLGSSLSGHLFVEPYLVTLERPIKEKAAFQHSGIEFIHVLSGSMIYKYAEKTHILSAGDSMLFDCLGTHGPQEAIELPIRYICVVFNLRT